MSRLEQLSQYGILIVALSAVVVSVWQVRILQNHNKLSVKPLMDYIIYSENNEFIEVKITNSGIGPAIIEGVTYHFEDKTYDDWNGVLTAAKVMEDVVITSGNYAGTVLSPTDELLMLRLKREDYQPIGVVVELSYKSIYEDPFNMKFEF